MLLIDFDPYIIPGTMGGGGSSLPADSAGYLQNDGSGNLVWDAAATPQAGGSDKEVQYNDGGTLIAGAAGLLYDKTAIDLAVKDVANDAAAGSLTFLKSRAGAAGQDADLLGSIFFKGYNDKATPELVEYAKIVSSIYDASDGTEDGQIDFQVMDAGTLQSMMSIVPGGVQFPNNPTAPSAILANAVQMWSADHVAGDARLYIMGELNTNATIIGGGMIATTHTTDYSAAIAITNLATGTGKTNRPALNIAHAKSTQVLGAALYIHAGSEHPSGGAIYQTIQGNPYGTGEMNDMKAIHLVHSSSVASNGWSGDALYAEHAAASTGDWTGNFLHLKRGTASLYKLNSFGTELRTQASTAPSAAVTDTVQTWCADYAAGDARLYIMGEASTKTVIIGNGKVIADGAELLPFSGSIFTAIADSSPFRDVVFAYEDVSTPSTWNPAGTHADITLSSGNLLATRDADNNGSMRSARGTTGLASGLKYFEITCSSGVAGDSNWFGIGNTSAALDSYVGGDANGWGFNLAGGTVWTSAGNSAYKGSATADSPVTFGIAVNMTTGKWWIRDSGGWYNAGDPVTEANPAHTGLSGTLYPMVSLRTGTNAFSVNFGASAFAYTVPTGFAAWDVATNKITGSIGGSVIKMSNTVTSPTAIAANKAQIWAADYAAGDARLYVMGESDTNKIALGGGKVLFTSAPADHTASGTTHAGICGESLILGDLCYFKSDGKYWKIDANAAATMPGVVICIQAGSADDVREFLSRGFFQDASLYGLTVGGLLYASETPGTITQTAPTTAGAQVQVLGYAYSADIIFFEPNLVMVEV